MTPASGESAGMTTTRLLSALLLLSSFACGDSGPPDASGVTGNKQVAQLTADEVMQFCDWAADVLDAPREVQCPDDVTVTFPSAEECAADYGSFPDTCMMNVAQAEACIHALHHDPCGGLGSSSCAPFIECALQQQ